MSASVEPRGAAERVLLHMRQPSDDETVGPPGRTVRNSAEWSRTVRCVRLWRRDVPDDRESGHLRRYTLNRFFNSTPYETSLEIWKDADEGIPEIEDAEERLAKLKNKS